MTRTTEGGVLFFTVLGEVIRNLRAQGITLQKIADAVGVGLGSVHRALESAFPFGKAEKVTGADGKERPRTEIRLQEIEPCR